MSQLTRTSRGLELYPFAQRMVRELEGTSGDVNNWLDECEDAPELSNEDLRMLLKYFDERVGRCVDCEYYVPLHELDGEVDGKECFSCRGPSS